MLLFESGTYTAKSEYKRIRKIARTSYGYLKKEGTEGEATEHQLFQTAARMAISVSHHEQVDEEMRRAYRDFIFSFLSDKSLTHTSFSMTQSLLAGLAHEEEMGWGHEEIEEHCEAVFDESFSYCLETVMSFLEPEKLATLKQEQADRIKADEEEALYSRLHYA